MTANLAVHKKLNKWFLNGETGLSSKSIVKFVVFGTKAKIDHPYDPADLRRCYLLLKAVPELIEPFRKNMAKASPEWKALISSWDILSQSLDSEIKLNGKVAPKTFQLMQEILAGVKKRKA